MKKAAPLLLALALSSSCGDKKPAEAAAPAPPTAVAGVPVQVAAASKRNLVEAINAPGHTTAMAQQKVRAPFAGTLSELRVADGDAVRRGDTLGTVVSRESGAALAGAREMARDARSATEKSDAERAIALAERSLVRAPLRASSDGVVLSHAAAAGDRVSEDQEILTIADAASIVFLADVGQAEVSRVRHGQAAPVELAGRSRPVPGTVHAVLPGANATDFTVPVRIDLTGLEGVPPVGLFGTAHITVAERRAATVVPDAAVVRDDVSGISRIALVRDKKAVWIDVTVGLRSGGVTEILSPPLRLDEPVIAGGQVGLPAGATVAVRP